MLTYRDKISRFPVDGDESLALASEQEISIREALEVFDGNEINTFSPSEHIIMTLCSYIMGTNLRNDLILNLKLWLR